MDQMEEDKKVVLRSVNQDPKAALSNSKSEMLDSSDRVELPQEFMKQWNRLSSDDQRAFQEYVQHMNLFDIGTVEVKAKEESGLNLKWEKKIDPFVLIPPEGANTVRRVDNGKRDLQLEAVLEGIEFIHKTKLPRGLILNKDNMMQTPVTTRQEVEGCNKMAEVLGKGNSAGDITVFKDKKTGQDMALKTVIISQFNPNEIRLWVQMGDLDLAPELYHFELVNNKLYFTMEIMTGKDLQQVIDENMWSFEDTSLARNFSLCILHDLLVIWDQIRSKNFIHGDLHAGNLRLETSMKVKIFDFGRAKSLFNEEKTQSHKLIKNDIVGIIRVFCALYSGFDFNDIFEAVKVLEAKNLKELDEFMIRISEENRKELYHIMTMLFDTVRKGAGGASPNSYGDTTEVSSHVKSLLSEDMNEIKRKAAVIIFPERFQNKAESEPVRDSVDAMLGKGKSHDLDPIWDDPDMEQFVNNVSDEALREMDAW